MSNNSKQVSLYRAMSFDEFSNTTENSLSFFKKNKFFGPFDFIEKRVLDGEFAFSKFKDKYTHLIKITFDEKYLNQFQKLNDLEYMLNIRKSNFPYTIKKIGLIKKPQRKPKLKM